MQDSNLESLALDPVAGKELLERGVVKHGVQGSRGNKKG